MVGVSSSPVPLRIGTRPSQLARTQAGLIADEIRALGVDVELVLISTKGDQSSAPLTAIGGTGVFVTAVREALLAGRCDLAVHSLKDLPVAVPPELVIAATPRREDPRDVLCARTPAPPHDAGPAAAGPTRDPAPTRPLRLSELPSGARIGTGSPRRALHLRRRRPDLTVTGLRGNVDSRLARVQSGELDGVVLAAAGLARLGRSAEASEVFSLDDSPPAPGQGALAIECRREDEHLVALLSALDDLPTRLAVTAERAVLAGLGAGCTAPVGASGRVEAGELRLRAVIWLEDGGAPIEASTALALPHATTDAGDVELLAEQVGLGVAQDLLTAGAASVPGVGELVDTGAHPARATEIPRIAVPPPADGSDRWALAARSAGLEPVAVTLLETRYEPEAAGTVIADLCAGDFTHLVLTSGRTVEALARAGSLGEAQRTGGFDVVAVGPATAEAARRAGLRDVRVPPADHSTVGVIQVLGSGVPHTGQSAARLILPHSDRAGDELAAGLRATGWHVQEATVYRVALGADLPPGLSSSPPLVFLTSPSSAQAWAQLAARRWHAAPEGSKHTPARAVCIGDTTATAARSLGIEVLAIADTADGPGIEAAMRRARELVLEDNELNAT